jgi:RNA polymerase sigma-B factor
MAISQQHSTPRHTHEHEYEELAPLFTELADSAEQADQFKELRAKLITEHLPIAEHIAQRFRNRGQAKEDLVQVATIGLINAVDRFDPTRGTDFLAFAVPTITGEVRRYFRESTWSMRVPRRLKELHAAITAAAARLSQEHGRAPRPSELAAELDLPIEEIYEGLQVSYAYRSESLDRPDHDGAGTLDDHLGLIDHDLTTVEHRQALQAALSRLPPREAAIVAMRFFGDMTQSQIGERIGVSQMQISRLLTSSLKLLKEALQDDVDPAPAPRSPDE